MPVEVAPGNLHLLQGPFQLLQRKCTLRLDGLDLHPADFGAQDLQHLPVILVRKGIVDQHRAGGDCLGKSLRGKGVVPHVDTDVGSKGEIASKEFQRSQSLRVAFDPQPLQCLKSDGGVAAEKFGPRFLLAKGFEFWILDFGCVRDPQFRFALVGDAFGHGKDRFIGLGREQDFAAGGDAA